jgi:DNA-binding response OmpR family regulator
LRRKIDEDEREPALFKTVRGMGFMLEAPPRAARLRPRTRN